MISSIITEVPRIFDYDYIYFDAIFLAIWIGLLIARKKYTPLLAGVVIAIPVYLIDAVIWWNSPTLQSTTGYVREYIIGGIQMPHPLDQYFWLKFGADFMMCISYSIYAFSWVWIMFQSWKTKNRKDMIFFSVWWFASWILTPVLSKAISWNETTVQCIRYMDSQLIAQIVTVACGFILMSVFYFTDRFNSKDRGVILYVFMVGCLQAFIMEFPLFITGIRPTEISLLIYEIFILTNQGAPYLYLIWDKIGPMIKDKIVSKDEKTEDITIEPEIEMQDEVLIADS